MLWANYFQPPYYAVPLFNTIFTRKILHPKKCVLEREYCVPIKSDILLNLVSCWCSCVSRLSLAVKWNVLRGVLFLYKLKHRMVFSHFSHIRPVSRGGECNRCKCTFQDEARVPFAEPKQVGYDKVQQVQVQNLGSVGWNLSWKSIVLQKG
jgi:hypothetical protein